jgi:phosphoadenosine phosphosulfate reductase
MARYSTASQASLLPPDFCEFGSGTHFSSSRWYHKSKDLIPIDKQEILAAQLARPLEIASAEEIVAWAVDTYGDRLAIVTSFQYEGMVILDMAARYSKNVRIVTLDTGRLPSETFEMIETVRARYGVQVEMISPDAGEIGAMVHEHGPNLFYESVPLRTACCHFRKVRPLSRKLAGFDAWLTGLRRSQADTRRSLEKFQTEEERLKISPLADWSAADVEVYTQRHHVPRHPLYAKGYTSIGCAPCSRATAVGEEERAGRWWWETETAKECGIHFTPDGRAVRTVDVLIREILNSSNAA